MIALANDRESERLRIAGQRETWLEDGRRYFRTLAGIASCFGVTTRTVREWKERGCPLETGRYDIAAVSDWRDKTLRRPPDPIDADPLLGSDGDSPALEEYRRAKAALARLELAEREGKLVPVDELHGLLTEGAAVLRRAGETLSRRFGNEALQVLNEALAEAEGLIGRLDEPEGD